MAYTMDDIRKMRKEYEASGKMASQMELKPVENPKYTMEDVQKMRAAITGEPAQQQIPSIADAQKASGSAPKKRKAVSSKTSTNPADHSNVKVTYKKKGNLEVGGTYNGYAVEAMGKKRGIRYSEQHPENSARIPSIEDYQKQDDSRSGKESRTVENKKVESSKSRDWIREAGGLPVLAAPQAKADARKNTKTTRSSSYLEGGSSNVSSSAYAAAKQNTGTKKKTVSTQQDILMPENATAEEAQSIVSKWSDPDYKLSSAEKKASQDYIDNYYKTARGFSGQSSLNPITRFKAAAENEKIRASWTPEEQAQYETVVALENKLSKGAAFTTSFADATGAVGASEQIGKNVAKSFTGKDTDIPTLESLTQGTKNQNPASAFAGSMAGQMAKYAFTKQLLGQIPGYDGLNQKLSEQFGKIPVLGKFGDNLANIAADTTVDLAADTLPQLVQNAQSGMSAGEVAKAAGKNIAGNVAWNVVGEGVGEGLKRIPSLPDLMKKSQNAAKQELPSLGNLGELSADDIAVLTEQAAKSADEVANTAKQGVENATAASKSVSDIPSGGTASKKEAYPVSYADSLPRTSTPKPEFTSSNNNIPNSAGSVNDFGKNAIDSGTQEAAGQIGKQKISKTRTNTLENSGINTEEELAKYMRKEDFSYLEITEKESMEEAAHRVATDSDGWKSKLLRKEELSGKDTDTLMMIYKNTVGKARQTGDEVLWNEAADIFKKIQTQSTKSGQQVQALAKWSRSTPEGALMEASRTVANAVDKVHGKGYSSAMDNVAEQVADAVKNSKSTEEALKKVESLLDMNLQFFAKDQKAPNVKIKGKDKVLEAVRNGAGWRDVMDIIKQQNNVGFIGVENQRQIYGYLDEAKNYAKDSRESKELIAKAAKIVADKTPQTIGSQVKSVLYDNMLGNFKTAVSRNAFGNLGYNVLEQSRQPLAAAVDRLVSLGTGKRTTTGWNAEKATAYLGGLKKGVVDEVKDIKAGVNTTKSGFDAFADSVNQNRRAFNGNGKLAKIANGIDNIVDHGMSFGDRPFYEANYAQAKAELQQIIKKYGEGALVNANRGDIETVIDSAAKVQALQSVFQDDGQIADALTDIRDAIGKFSKGVAGVDVLSMAASPFVKTPGNMLSRAVEYSPFGVVKNAVGTGAELAKGNFNQRRFVDETSRNLMGTALLGGTYAAAQSGLTTGGYSGDYDEKQAQRDAGMLEYAIQLPNGLQLDAGDIPALGPLIEAGAKMKESGDPIDGSLQALGAIAAGSTMQGMNRLFGSDSGFSTDDPDIVSNVKNTLLSSGTQLVPSLVRQTAQTIDPYKRDMGEYGTLDYYKNLVKNQIPGLRQTLPVKYNEEGIPVLQNQGRDIGSKILENYFLPMNVSEYQPSALTEEASRLLETTGENIAFIPKAYRSDAKKLLGGEYSEDAFQQYKRELGGMKAEAGNALMQADVYQNMTDDEKVKALQNVYSAMKAAKKAEITGEDPTNKLAQAYQEKGTQGMLDYMSLDNASRSQFISSDGSAKSFASANTSEKLKVMEQQGMSAEEMGQYLDSDNIANGAKKAKEARGYEGIYDYYKIKSEADSDGNGSLKQNELIPYLENKEYDEETKRLYFSLFFPDAEKNPFG